ncbi:MAG TPA: DUF4142 domain-containing protein [Caulobacteraceae bacterium]|jgi:putative membrane protein
MRGRLMVAAAAVSVLSVSACDRGGDNQAAAAPPSPAAAPPPVPPMPPAGAAAGFAARTALNDMYEVEAGRLALERTGDNDVKRFAQMMVDDHSRTSNEVRAMIAQQAVQAELPSQLDAENRARVDALTAAAPADFDQRYIDQQIAAHESALALLKDYARGGDNQAFRDWASRTAPAIENHLQMARGLKRAPAGDSAGDAATN